MDNPRIMKASPRGARVPPRRPIAPPPKSGGGGFVKFLFLLLALGGLGYGAYWLYNKKGMFIKEYELPKIIDPSKDLGNKLVDKPVEKTVAKPIELPKEPEPPKKKSPAEMKIEAKAAKAEVAAAIAAARRDGSKSLPGFAGLSFGDVVKRAPIYWEALPGSNGVAIVTAAPKVSKAFREFGTEPLVWVTPKTRKIFRIELEAKLKTLTKAGPDKETLDTVETLKKKLKREPFSVDVEKFPMAEREYVFPFGETTLTVGEYGGAKLKLIAENNAMWAQVKSETEALRQEKMAEPGLGAALGSKRYPNGGKAKGKPVYFKDGTPYSFCGISFNTLPPLGADFGHSAKRDCFFIDYRKSKCEPFMGFDHGKASLTSEGGVYAVSLYSGGATEGLTDDEYFDKVSAVLKSHFKVAPKETRGDGPFPDLVFAVGDVNVSFGPDPNGGFYLKAVNLKLEVRSVDA